MRARRHRLALGLGVATVWRRWPLLGSRRSPSGRGRHHLSSTRAPGARLATKVSSTRQGRRREIAPAPGVFTGSSRRSSGGLRQQRQANTVSAVDPKMPDTAGGRDRAPRRHPLRAEGREVMRSTHRALGHRVRRRTGKVRATIPLPGSVSSRCWTPSGARVRQRRGTRTDQLAATDTASHQVIATRHCSPWRDLTGRALDRAPATCSWPAAESPATIDAATGRVLASVPIGRSGRRGLRPGNRPRLCLEQRPASPTGAAAGDTLSVVQT
jgi:hypothetical protein